MFGLDLAALATACIGMAAILAAAISALLYAERPLPRSLPIADALFGVAGLILHFVAQISAQIDNGFVIAIPFITIGVVSGVVLVVRVLTHHRPVRLLSLAHAATLVIGLALVVQGLGQKAGNLQ